MKEFITIGQLKWIEGAIRSGLLEDKDYSELTIGEASKLIGETDHKFKEELKKK